ncbi:DsbA family protein, partial [Candidatus Microgenomates bacterium]
ATRCAQDQNKFWEFHDVLFEKQPALSVANLKQYAVDLGLNASQFNTCLDTAKYEQAVKDDMTAGEQVGVRGTPASFVGTVNGNTFNGVQISGAVPFETFKAQIDPLL